MEATQLAAFMHIRANTSKSILNMDTLPSQPFGVWVKQRRNALDLTQEEIARRIGCSVAMIRKIESGLRQPSRQLAARLAETLQLLPETHPRFVQAARDRTPPRQAPVLALAEPAERALAPHNLPAQLTPLIGRATDVSAVHGLLQRGEVRLLTLSGPPGVGKSRLAMQVALDLLPAFPDGVFLVAMAAVGDPALVAQAAARAISADLAAAGDPWKELALLLQDRRLLLVLNDFEYVLDAAPQVVELLKHCPQLKLLVTSRVVLRLSGEHDYPVRPLACPDPDQPMPYEQLREVPAVALFVERAHAIKPGFTLTEANASTVAKICAHLDGLPLAIEMAARRGMLLSPDALLAKLHHRLSILTNGTSDAPERHQTLRDAIGWSYQRLKPSEQHLLAALSVFTGSSTLEAIEAVWADTRPEGDTLAMLDDLDALVNQSLVYRIELGPEQVRFAVLGAVREYALERLRERAAHHKEVSARHADYVV